ncbi:MAG: NADH-quinone oxidoreductase subunit H [Holophagaceae bacterium]|uniref:NADH-quinone oxidoreductase subunit H n=1 Tax=Candidatus Geothrix odensensis TaxID=2954440 RepID=A0A936K5K8_9BACT|nr:NADH-quinone oxidoreductase subunit H [Candidatus Geothrix odensensis]
MSPAAIFTWIERRGSAMIRIASGPTRPRCSGRSDHRPLAQILAYGIKMFFKEDLIPAAANRGLFFLAPASWRSCPPSWGFAVIPFGKSFVTGGTFYHLSVLDPGNGPAESALPPWPLGHGGLQRAGGPPGPTTTSGPSSAACGPPAAMVTYEIGMSLAVNRDLACALAAAIPQR